MQELISVHLLYTALPRGTAAWRIQSWPRILLPKKCDTITHTHCMQKKGGYTNIHPLAYGGIHRTKGQQNTSDWPYDVLSTRSGCFLLDAVAFGSHSIENLILNSERVREAWRMLDWSLEDDVLALRQLFWAKCACEFVIVERFRAWLIGFLHKRLRAIGTICT